MFWLIAGGVVLVLALAAVLALRRFRNPPLLRFADGRPLPQPPETHFLLGHKIGDKATSEVLREWVAGVGGAPVWQIRLGPYRGLVTSDAATNERILNLRPDNNQRMPAFRDATRALVGAGPTNEDGDLWRRYRHDVARVFTRRRVEEREPLLRKHIVALVDGWRNAAPTTITVQQLLNLSCAAPDVREFWSGLSRDAHALFRALGARSLAAIPWHKVWPSAEVKRQNEAIKRLRMRVHSTIVAIKDTDTASFARDDDGVEETFLAALKNSSLRLSDVEIEDQIVQILAAGNETTYILMSWVCRELALDASLQDAVLAAIAADDAAGRDPVDNELVHAIVLELLRVRSTVPFLLGSVVAPVVLETPIGSVALQEGNTLGNAIAVQSRSTDVFGADADEFRAHRWLEMSSEQKSLAKRRLLTFGGGVRRCPGEWLATLETRIFIVELVKRVRLGTMQKHVSLRLDFTEQPAEGIVVDVEKRCL